MAAKNDITGASIKSGILSKAGRDNWDDIFPPKKSAYEWLANEYRHITLLDPDGWRRNDGVSLETKITKSDFENRLTWSTTIQSKHAFYKLFLDDQRDPCDAYLYDEKAMLCEYLKVGFDDWTVVRSYEAFIDQIEMRGVPMLVSFDHDLTFEHARHYLKYALESGYIEYENFANKTGKECAEYLVRYCKERKIGLPRCYVHSANDVGRANIKKVLRS